MSVSRSRGYGKDKRASVVCSRSKACIRKYTIRHGAWKLVDKQNRHVFCDVLQPDSYQIYISSGNRVFCDLFTSQSFSVFYARQCAYSIAKNKAPNPWREISSFKHGWQSYQTHSSTLSFYAKRKLWTRLPVKTSAFSPRHNVFNMSLGVYHIHVFKDGFPTNPQESTSPLGILIEPFA